MRFLVDECFPKRVVLLLRAEGLDAISAHDVAKSKPDETVLAIATRTSRILVTEDRDFGTLLFRDRRPAIGVVVVHASEFPGGITWYAESLSK